jgi:hypothetical protein
MLAATKAAPPKRAAAPIAPVIIGAALPEPVIVETLVEVTVEPAALVVVTVEEEREVRMAELMREETEDSTLEMDELREDSREEIEELAEAPVAVDASLDLRGRGFVSFEVLRFWRWWKGDIQA